MADEQPQETPRVTTAEPVKSSAGFFTIYKRGQGYWTRMGTALAAALVCVLLGQFLYTQISTIQLGRDADGRVLFVGGKIAAPIALAIVAALGLFAWRLMNKPGNVDFLVATDSEMKKVNWTTRKELIGSTKVVIFFVVLIAAILFGLDIVFGYLFYAIKVLVVPPL